MTTFFYILLGAILGVVAALVLTRKRIKELEIDLERTKKEKEEQADFVSGIDEFNRRTQEIKEGKKQKIIDGLSKQENIKTSEVADFLEISRATAFRYLEELEKEGKIEQVGSYGKDVKYRIK